MSDTAALGTFVKANEPLVSHALPEMTVMDEIPLSPPSRVRRGRSKIMSVLRALTNSASSISNAEPLSLTSPVSPVSPMSPEGPLSSSASKYAVSTPSVSPSNGLNKKLSISYLKGHLEPTVVHRSQFKSRPSVISQEKIVVEVKEESPPSSAGDSSNGKSSKSSGDPRPSQSTGKTSLESKVSTKSKVASPQSSENKKLIPEDGESPEGSLAPIAEVDTPLPPTPEPEPTPTFMSVEKAAAAKIFFECHYNDLTSGRITPRSMRRRVLEGELYQDTLSTTSEKIQKKNLWAQRETDHLREMRVMKARGANALKGKDETTAMYEAIKVLGKGSFGVVRLVRERPEKDAFQNPLKKKEVFAMKVIRKSDMLRNSQEGHLRAERDFLVAAEGSRWVVPLIASFQDPSNLYLVMDYMPGGDFLGLLIRDNVLSEPVAKFYIAEMILCIEEAHSLRWIHRDVKPDNFLIAASGHLKISDFGLAFDGHWSHDQAYYNNHRYSLLEKLGIKVEGDSIDRKEGRLIASAISAAVAQTQMAGKERHHISSSNEEANEGILNWRNRHGNRTLARSVVGTSQYMAPEVVLGGHYDARCDWWSVAIILFECLYGHTPFLAEEGGRQATKANIVRHKDTFHFPHKPVVSRRCQDLIRNMVQDAEFRLCSRRYSRELINTSSRYRDATGRYVYPNDAEDIKGHKWFRDIQWDRLHLMTPPFVPDIKAQDDTHYFDEEDTISDFSESAPDKKPDPNEVASALRSFNREIQILAVGYIDKPHDSTRLKKVEKEIDTFHLSEEKKDYLKAFVKHYGKKEKKRPRDRLLRDKEFAGKVLELRKKGAFLGYTYRRIRRGRESATGNGGYVVGSVNGGRPVWHRSRLSIH
ncbi:Serine/threonine-protein kinase cbk1 [Phlyctema vagabunda]|uniref:non-specific serine/threonine protein kinase n=1 Tax=Phlyctema vagabunda TaxID=108571 RepID=A0ABR4P719_9HELO